MPTLQNIFSTDSLGINEIVNAESSFAEVVMSGEYNEILNRILTWFISFGGKLLLAIAIFIVGRWIIKKLLRLENRLFKRVEMDGALQGFLKNLTAIGLYVALFALIISIVGVQTISLAALIASAGLAIGLAMRDNLANFAGGVILLFNKPFKGGDHIKAQDIEGIVDSVGILYTILHTFDNKMIYIPNGPLSTGNIVNMSTQPIRRVNAPARAEYGTPVPVVREALMSLIKKHDKILLNPEPLVRMMGMSETSVDFQLRVWVKYEDYWEVFFWINEAIYTEFNNRGIGMPFTKMVMHTTTTEEATNE